MCQAFVLRILIFNDRFPSTNVNQVRGRGVSRAPQLNDKVKGIFPDPLDDVILRAEETAGAQALWWYLALRLRAGVPDYHPPR